MNDVTSMLYVSPVRQFETPLFYAVTSRIEALVVSCHKFLNACVEKVYRLLLQPIVYCRFYLCSFRKCRFSVTIRCTVFRDTFGKNSARSVMVKRLFPRIFTSICCTRSGVTTLGRPLHLSSCTLSWPLSNCLHHRRTIVTRRSFSKHLTHLPVNIGWLDIPGL